MRRKYFVVVQDYSAESAECTQSFLVAAVGCEVGRARARRPQGSHSSGSSASVPPVQHALSKAQASFPNPEESSCLVLSNFQVIKQLGANAVRGKLSGDTVVSLYSPWPHKRREGDRTSSDYLSIWLLC